MEWDFAKQLQRIEKEALSVANFNMSREGFFKGVLRSAFARTFEFARLVHKHKLQDVDETGFFLAAGLRGIAEDLISLRFIRKLKRSDRDEVIKARMMITVADVEAKQRAFFKRNRPFQPIIKRSFPSSEVARVKDRLTTIGHTSGMWRTANKLPPVEQMAARVKLKQFYQFIYAATSELVHFNVRIALRSGWGRSPQQVVFSTKNFAPYYLEFAQFFSVYILIKFCRSFRRDLGLSTDLMKVITEMQIVLNDRLRWPEAVTFEEMNVKNPNELIRIVLKVAHLEKQKAKRQ